VTIAPPSVPVRTARRIERVVEVAADDVVHVAGHSGLPTSRRGGRSESRAGGRSGAPASRIGESTTCGAPSRTGMEVGEAALESSVRPSPGWTTRMANRPPRGGRSVATRGTLGVAILSIRGVPPICQRGNTKKLRSGDGRHGFAPAARPFAASHKRASAVGSMPSTKQHQPSGTATCPSRLAQSLDREGVPARIVRFGG
jgi:hypothetical protein